jgi:hypothetical protein
MEQNETERKMKGNVDMAIKTATLGILAVYRTRENMKNCVYWDVTPCGYAACVGC